MSDSAHVEIASVDSLNFDNSDVKATLWRAVVLWMDGELRKNEFLAMLVAFSFLEPHHLFVGIHFFRA